MNKFYKFLIYLLLIFCPLIFFTDLTRNPYYFQIFLLNALVLFIWSIYLLQSVLKGKIQWVFTPIDLPLLVFILTLTLSFLVAYFSKQPYHVPEIIQEGKVLPNFNLDFLKASIFSEGTKKLVFTLVNLLLAYYLTSVLIPVLYKSEEREKTVLNFYNVIFIVGFIAGIYGIMQYFGIEVIWPQELNPFGGRPVSTFGNPNFMSSYLVIIVPILLTNFLLSRSTGKKIFFLILIVTYGWALISTMTRSSWMGAFAAVVIVVLCVDKPILRQNYKWITLIFLIGIISFCFWPRSIGGTTTIGRITDIKDTFEKPYGPMHQRILIWGCALQMVNEKPILGKGWGLFELFYPFYQGKGLFNPLYRRFRTHANNTHNEIFEYWSQAGTVGLAVYIWFLVAFFVYGKNLLKNAVLSQEKKFFVIGILAGTAGMIVDNIFGNVSTQFCVPAFLFWWNIGALSLFDNTTRVFEYKLNGIPKALLVIIAIFFLFLVYRWYNFFIGEVNYFKGFKLSKRNEVTAAIKYLEEAHRKNREVNSEYELGNCYARTNQKDKAIWAYYQALAANCGYDEIHFNLATVYAQKGDLTNAIRNYTQALFINPTSQEAYQALGGIFLTNIRNYLEEAEALFKQAVYFFPENVDFWNNLGYVYTIKGDNMKAIESYRNALKVNPEFQAAKHNLIAALQKAGIKNDPILEYGDLVNLVERKIQEQNWLEVERISKRLVSISPKNFRARFYLANALFTLGKIDEAIAEYQEALNLQPSNVPLLTNLGLAYVHKKDFNNAKEIFNKIIQLEPQNQFAQQQLSLLKNMK